MMAQVGGGFEVRVSQHVGILTDFSWNIVSGANNNFGLARTGVNFSFQNGKSAERLRVLQKIRAEGRAETIQ